MRQFGNYSGKKLKWGYSNILYDGTVKTNNCAVVIPIYKTVLTKIESASLQKVINTLGSNYDIYLLHGKSLKINSLSEKFNFIFGDCSCEDVFLSGRAPYSDMCEMKEFYQMFSKYQYILIYQLDAWIFEDRLEYFIKHDYDFYGSIHTFSGHSNAVGNGGFSLRKVSSFIKVCTKYENKNIDIPSTYPEDLCFTVGLKNEIKIAPLNLCLEFGFQNSPKLLFIKNKNKLPMGCHAFEKCDFNWWKKYIKIENMTVTEPKTISEKLLWPKSNY